MTTPVLPGPWWPHWVELDLAPVGLTLRGRYWRLLDLSPVATGSRPVAFGSKFQQRRFAVECAAEEWESELARRAEAALPLGVRPGFLAFLNGVPVAGGRVVSDALRRARECLPAGSKRALRKRIEIAPASQAAMGEWAAHGGAARIVKKGFSRHWSCQVVLRFDEAEAHAAAFTDRVGWVSHDWLEIQAFGAMEADARQRGKAGIMAKYDDGGGGLETCEATAAGRDLVQAGVNLWWEATDEPGQWTEPEFVEGEVHLWRIPGSDVTHVVCCSSAEGRALHAIGELIPRREEDPFWIRVDLT